MSGCRLPTVGPPLKPLASLRPLARAAHPSPHGAPRAHAATLTSRDPAPNIHPAPPLAGLLAASARHSNSASRTWTNSLTPRRGAVHAWLTSDELTSLHVEAALAALLSLTNRAPTMHAQEHRSRGETPRERNQGEISASLLSAASPCVWVDPFKKVLFSCEWGESCGRERDADAKEGRGGAKKRKRAARAEVLRERERISPPA